SSSLCVTCVALVTIANIIRWLGSGPRCGFYEIQLPDRQPGSSIMPGKVNPVMCESMMQVCARVMGNDQVLAISGAYGGQFQLNIMMPVMGQTTLESITLLSGGVKAVVDLCAGDMEANTETCDASVEKSLSMVTSLNPHIGYERAAALAKEAFKSGKAIRELCREQNTLPEPTLKSALDPGSMTEPHEQLRHESRCHHHKHIFQRRILLRKAADATLVVDELLQQLVNLIISRFQLPHAA